MEAEYHHWYSEFHLDEVLQVPDFVAAERYSLVESDGSPDLDDTSHFAVFTVASDDISATMSAFRDAQKSMTQPACLDADSVALSWWRPFTNRVTSGSPVVTDDA